MLLGCINNANNILRTRPFAHRTSFSPTPRAKDTMPDKHDRGSAKDKDGSRIVVVRYLYPKERGPRVNGNPDTVKFILDAGSMVAIRSLDEFQFLRINDPIKRVNFFNRSRSTDKISSIHLASDRVNSYTRLKNDKIRIFFSLVRLLERREKVEKLVVGRKRIEYSCL